MDRVEPDDPVHPGGDVALELAHGPVRARTEDPVLLAGVEPERVQHPLERTHVVPAERRRTEVERPVAEPVTGLDELPPRVGAHDPVRRQPARTLEPPDRLLGGRPERSIELVRLDAQAGGEQPMLHVSDVFSSRSTADEVHARSLRGTAPSGNRMSGCAAPTRR